MRARLATCIVAIWTTELLTAVKAETWCIRDGAGVTSEICAFSSAHDCVRAALVGPAGGTICAQQTAVRRTMVAVAHFRTATSGRTPATRQSDTENGRRRESTSDANRLSA
jgi:hypothetical protein